MDLLSYLQSVPSAVRVFYGKISQISDYLADCVILHSVIPLIPGASLDIPELGAASPA
jgi:hypothetical protein